MANLCVHCKQWLRHHLDGKCLFDSTTYTEMTLDQQNDYFRSQGDWDLADDAPNAQEDFENFEALLIRLEVDRE